MENKWVEHAAISQEELDTLCQSLNIDPILCSLLVQRGIRSFEDARLFFRPHLDHLHDPFLMKDMDKAVCRIDEAVSGQEKILIYGDYDVDGTTAVAVVVSYLQEIYPLVEFYVPDRETEGYGISKQGIDWAVENGFSLIIALDCGIKAIAEVDYARERGVDFIIGDHHNPAENLPSAIAVLDPKRNDCPYPYKELSGCGIGFKIIQAHAQRHGMAAEKVMRYLDLVAVSIASDIVPITGENRVLACYGLNQLNNDPCPGLFALKAMATHRAEFGIDDIVFQIGPRINAAGRIRHADDAVRLLLAKNKQEALALSGLIEDHNATRREVDAKITNEAIALIRSDSQVEHQVTTVVYNESWHKGVIGIVASRLIEKYYKPTVVLTRSNGRVTGSARSIQDFDLYAALERCEDLLIQFGGHKYAAGLTLEESNVSAFQTRFEEVAAKSIRPEQLIRKITIDQTISLEDITPKFLRILKQFAPFGPKNPSPIFCSKGVSAGPFLTVVGKNHLRMTVSQRRSAEFKCIGFGLGGFVDQIREGKRFDICYQIGEQYWKEQRYWQLYIKDIKFSNN